MPVDSYDPAARSEEEHRICELLAMIRALRAATESPMVDTNLRTMEELCLHLLAMFTDDVELHPYLELLTKPPG